MKEPIFEVWIAADCGDTREPIADCSNQEAALKRLKLCHEQARRLYSQGCSYVWLQIWKCSTDDQWNMIHQEPVEREVEGQMLMNFGAGQTETEEE